MTAYLAEVDPVFAAPGDCRSRCLATYEYDCTGTSRKADLLTDGYKKECDPPHGLKRDPRRASAPVVWTKPAKHDGRPNRG